MRTVLSAIVGCLLVLIMLKTCVEGHSMARNEKQDLILKELVSTVAELKQQLVRANVNTAKQVASVRQERKDGMAPCDLTGFVFEPINLRGE